MTVNKPFFLPSGPVGCLLIHGYNSGPFEMIELSRYLAKRGITCNAIMLPGHGGIRPSDLKSIKAKHWFKEAKKGLYTLKKLGIKTIFVCGHSLGGLIAINLATKFKWIKGIILLASPAHMSHWEERLVDILDKKNIYIPTSDFFTHKKEIKKIYRNQKRNEKLPIESIKEVINYIDKTRRKLKNVKCHVLIVQSRGENFVPKDSAKILYDGMTKAKSKTIKWTQNSGHSLLLESEKVLVQKYAASFIKRHS